MASNNPFFPDYPPPPDDNTGYGGGYQNTPIDSGILFNERGYSKSSSISKDAQELINDYNGSLSFDIPLYNFKGPGDLRADLKLVYNPSVNHNIFTTDPIFKTYNEPFTQYNYGFGEWILSLNGIGIQVLNFECNFYSLKPNVGDDIIGNNIKYLVNGYHITRDAFAPDSDKRIYILQGDGSVDVLQKISPNTTTAGHSPSDWTVGRYVTKDNYGASRGKVEFINPAPSGSYYDYFYLRKLYYMKGDGLTYFFEETHYPFYDFPTPPGPLYVAKDMKVFILKSIKDRFGNILEIEYSNQINNTDLKGRPVISKIKCNWDQCSEIVFDFISMAEPINPNIKIKNTIRGDYQLNLQAPIVPFENVNYNHRGYITSVKNQLNQTMHFDYESYNRKMISLLYGCRIFGIQTQYQCNLQLENLQRIKNFKNYFGGETIYTYKEFTPEDIIMNMNEVNQVTQSRKIQNYWGQGRDLFFCNMLLKKECKIDNVKYKEENFTYGYSDPNLNRLSNPIDENDSISTVKEIVSFDQSTLNSTPSRIKWERTYRAYKTRKYQFNYSSFDYGSTIKLISEKLTKYIDAADAEMELSGSYELAPYYNKETLYYIGNGFSDGVGGFYYDGSFLPSTIKEHLGYESAIKFTFNLYTHFTSADNPNWYGPDNLNPVRILRLQYDSGSGSRYNISEFKSFFIDTNYPLLNGIFNPTANATQNYDSDNRFIYLLNCKISEEIRNTANQKLTYTEWQYLLPPDVDLGVLGYYGQLKSQKVTNVQNNEILISKYQYAVWYTLGRELYTPQSIMPSIEGNLIQVTSPKGNIKRFFYHPVDANENVTPTENVPKINTIVVLTNEVPYNIPQYFQDRRYPTRTDYYPNGLSGYPLRGYQLHDDSGNVTQAVTPNKILTFFKYDKIGRIVRIISPFDFTNPNPFYLNQGYTTAYLYDDSVRSALVQSKMTDSISKKVETLFDGFYRMIETREYIDENIYNQYNSYFNYLDQKAISQDPLQYQTKYSYTEFGEIKKIQNQDNSESLINVSYQNFILNYNGQSSYTDIIRKEVWSDEENNKVEKYYDRYGNLLKQIRFVPQERESEEEILDSLITPKKLETDYYYDVLNNLTKVVSPEKKEIKYTYDGFSRLIQKQTPDAGIIRYLYDKDSNIVFSQNAVQSADRANLYSFYSYDAASRLLGVGESGNLREEFPDFDYLDPDSTYYFNEVNTDAPVSNLNDYLTYNIYDTLTNSPTGLLVDIPLDYLEEENYTWGNLACIAFRTRKSESWNFKYFRYDAKGRLKKMWLQIHDFDIQTFEFNYNSMNNVVQCIYDNNGHNGRVFRYVIDQCGRLEASQIQPSNVDTTFVNFVDYIYNENSSTIGINLNQSSYSISNSFDNRNRLTNIDAGIFNYSLEFYKNSNISKQSITGKYKDDFSNTQPINLDFYYDSANRLTKTKTIVGTGYIDVNITNTYDLDSNITRMIRDYNNDNFSYSYYSGTNKLKQVTGGDPQFEYDLNGNLKNDSFTKNYNMLYDYRNLLLEVKSEVGQTNPPTYYYTRYWYDDNGNRIKKLVLNSLVSNPSYPDWNNPTQTGNWGIYQTINYSQDASGKDIVIFKDGDLDYYNIWGTNLIGKITSDDSKYFYIKDHLDSIRVVLNEANQRVACIDYDVWGNIIREWQPEDTTNKFISKERDFESSYDYIGVRQYNSRIARWNGQEPRLESFQGYSPYIYSLQNPLKLKDSNGRGPKINVNGDNVTVTWDIYYNTSDNDNDGGLDADQQKALKEMGENIKQDWSGDFNIQGKNVHVNVVVNYHENQNPPNSSGAYMLARNANQNTLEQSDLNKIKKEQGVGTIYNTFYLMRGSDLQLYSDSGAHEAGHAMGLAMAQNGGHPQAIPATDPKLTNKPPIMAQAVTVTVTKKINSVEKKNVVHLRQKPTSNDWNLIFKQNNFNINNNGDNIINHND